MWRHTRYLFNKTHAALQRYAHHPAYFFVLIVLAMWLGKALKYGGVAWLVAKFPDTQWVQSLLKSIG